MTMNNLNALPLPVCRDVTLKNLSRYSFSWDGERLEVRARRRGKVMNGETRTYGLRYKLSTDSGTRKTRSLSERQILFLLRFSELDCEKIDFRSFGLTSDGTVTLPGKQAKKRKAYSTFKSIDDAIETCLIIKAFQQGNEGPLYLWIHDAKRNATNVAHRLEHCGYTAALEAWDDAVETFTGELRNMNVRRIQPLFSWLCKCLRHEIIKRNARRKTLNELKLYDPVI